MNGKMTTIEAYKAMIKFMEKYYERTNSDDIGSLLGDLQLLSDGSTADEAAWTDWLDSVNSVTE